MVVSHERHCNIANPKSPPKNKNRKFVRRDTTIFGTGATQRLARLSRSVGTLTVAKSYTAVPRRPVISLSVGQTCAGASDLAPQISVL